MKRVYIHIEALSDEEIKDKLKRNELEELIYLPLSVGLYHHNWKVAQDNMSKPCST